MKIKTIIIIIYVGTQLTQAIFNGSPPYLVYRLLDLYLWAFFFHLVVEFEHL